MSPAFAVFAAVLAAGADAGPPAAAPLPAPAPTPPGASASFPLPAAGFTPETACSDYELKVMLVASPLKSVGNRMNLDRRSSDVLAEERRLEALAAPEKRPGHGLPLVLLLAGVAFVLAGTARKSYGFAGGGALLLLLAGAVAASASEDQLALRTRIDSVRACRLRLLETKTQIEHGEYARALDTIGEADEDLMMFRAQLQGGRPITVEQIEKLRKEMTHQP